MAPREMNLLERLLQDDLNGLVHRISTATSAGTFARCASQRPELRARIEQAEVGLASARRALIEGYAAWQQALGECADLWALADLAIERLPAATAEARAA